jgi:isopenicillin-N N-acyltransferase-like protein
MTLPIVHLSGTPAEQGMQHGRALRDQIWWNLAEYDACFAREGLNPAEVRDRAARYLDAMAAQNADYVAAIGGIAAGADVDPIDVAALNVRYEILYYQFGINSPPDGCTAFAVTPRVSTNGHLLLGDNWDWIPEVKGAVLHTVEPDGLQTLSFSEAGIVGGKIGLNSAGLGLAINGISTTDDDWSRLSKPFHLRCYEILRAREIEPAEAIVREGVRSCSANFLIAQVPDRVIDLEAAPRQVRAYGPTAGFVVHANHFVDPTVLGVVETESEYHEGSCFRQERLGRLLRSRPAVSVADVQSYLADHEQYPLSVCYHVAAGAPPDERYATVASVILDLHDRTMWVSDGPPCENGYERVDVLTQS